MKMKKVVFLALAALSIIAGAVIFLGGDIAGISGLLLCALFVWLAFRKPKATAKHRAAVSVGSEIYANMAQFPESITFRGQSLNKTYDYRKVQLAFPAALSDGIGQMAFLYSEPENEYDSKAVFAVCNNEKIGYIYRGKRQDMLNDYMKKGLPVVAVIDNLDPLSLRIAFYR